MSDNSVDPSGNTEAFRAFTNAPGEPEAASSRTPLIIGGIVAAVIVVAVLVWALI